VCEHIRPDCEHIRPVLENIILICELRHVCEYIRPGSDRSAAIEFITNMERENPDLNIDITIYENIQLGTSVFESPAKLFDSYRYLFVFA
jgi:hypothetical protein